MNTIESLQSLGIRFYEKTKTKSGKEVSSWAVPCNSCGVDRIIKRAEHAKNFVNIKCKKCSNIDNHPQGEYRGIRISFFKKYKLSAISRAKDFDVDIDYVADLADSQDRKCALSKIKLTFVGDFEDITASLDRIDNKIGYVKGNLQWVHKDINMMRGNLNIERFIDLCKLVCESNTIASSGDNYL